MKFKFRDIVTYSDDFATYTGYVSAHYQVRLWYTLWIAKEDWYEVNIFEVNEEEAGGVIIMPGKHLNILEETTKPKKSSKVLPIKPKK